MSGNVRPSSELDPPFTAVRDAVERALREDLEPLGDVTSTLLPPDLVGSANVVARGEGILAGTACAAETFHQVDAAIECGWRLGDGGSVEPGEVIATLHGPMASILTAERTALNFLGHLSGIATLTRRFVRAAHGNNARIWDTRKTTPGLRALQKAAVRAGGGANHRGNLSEWVLVKDNHLGDMSVAEAIRRARLRWPGRTVQVEADKLSQVREAIEADADIVLLDNMDADQVTFCVELRGDKRRPLLEVSGGVTLQTVAEYAATGVDLISVGAITNSAPVLDIGLDLLTEA
ncbi:MAG TPA: carboxylating nicotinate-nucleotide diphosphorylase [Acidimicrobiales bacterium]|nr:carboxylating nicotinate-nucleotide diphosphorylase [Acidimicrobiales bacterium]